MVVSTVFMRLVWENQISARETTPTKLTFGVRWTKKDLRLFGAENSF